MFIVVNKEKIYTYLVSIITVVLLFVVATTFTKNQTVQVSAQQEKLLPIYKVNTEENKVALTLNCAWNNTDIDQILEILKKHNIKLTFFIVGDWAKKYPESVKKIHEAGHEIGTHSNTHPHVNNLTYEQNIEEIKEGSQKIKDITNQDIILYRTPYGEYNNTCIQAANDLKYYTIQWSLDTLDYTGITGEEMWKRLDKKIGNGDIILMHNGTKNTANSLEYLIKNIEDKGLKIVRVSDLIYKENYKIDINGTQTK